MHTTAVQGRISTAREALAHAGADWLLVPPSADFRWLTGAVARSTERLVALALPKSGDPFVLVPRLEAEALKRECPWLDFVIWDEHEDPFERMARRLNLERKPALLVGEGLRVSHLLRLTAAARCRPASDALAPLRAVKDADELRLLEEAARHADRIVEETADFARPGMTEREIARFAAERFDSLGDIEVWTIVATGPNSALPHHFTSDRKLETQDVLLIDIGGFTGGYASDITRTYWIGRPPSEAERVYEVVNEARNAGIAASRAGAACETVDQAARAVIERAGFGEFFTHRTGHGLGLEVHEPPYLVAGNRSVLEIGNVHSVEPGIYLPGRFGVRLEDIVVVESARARRLNQAALDPRAHRLRA